MFFFENKMKKKTLLMHPFMEFKVWLVSATANHVCENHYYCKRNSVYCNGDKYSTTYCNLY